MTYLYWISLSLSCLICLVAVWQENNTEGVGLSFTPRERSERGEKRDPEPNPKTNEPRRLL